MTKLDSGAIKPLIAPKAAVLGWPIDHSLSPLLHRFWLEELGLQGSYEKRSVPPEELRAALQNLASDKYAGVNLTVPHKEEALRYMQNLDPVARRIGAINLVLVRKDGTLEGRNTDVYGFQENLLSADFTTRGRPAVILGAGGGARAAIAALLDLGVKEIRVVNRTSERSEELRAVFGNSVTPVAFQERGAALESAELLVNATSLGMKGQPELEITLDALPGDALVTDIVYVPLETTLLRRAHMRGNPTLDGIGMLLHQARPAFTEFYGHRPAVTEALRSRMVLALAERG